jgi:hypothetical protein
VDKALAGNYTLVGRTDLTYGLDDVSGTPFLAGLCALLDEASAGGLKGFVDKLQPWHLVQVTWALGTAAIGRPTMRSFPGSRFLCSALI